MKLDIVLINVLRACKQTSRRCDSGPVCECWSCLCEKQDKSALVCWYRQPYWACCYTVGDLINAACWYARNFLSVTEIVLNFRVDGALLAKVFLAGSKTGIESELSTLQPNFGGFLQVIADRESYYTFKSRDTGKYCNSLNIFSEVDFVKQYVEAGLTKMPVFRALLASGTRNPADYALIQNSPESDAAIDRSFSKPGKLLL